MEQREELLRKLPALETVLVTTQNFKKIIAKKELASDLEYFVRLFDGARSLGRIIDESKYDEITTLNRILKLYELGFLHSLRDYEQQGAPGELTGAAERATDEAGQAGTFPPAGLEHVEKAIGSEIAEELLHEQIDGTGSEAERFPAEAEFPLLRRRLPPAPGRKPGYILSLLIPPAGIPTAATTRTSFMTFAVLKRRGRIFSPAARGLTGGPYFPISTG